MSILETQSKPKFSDLSGTQVNDLVATEIMGYIPHSEYPSALWITPEGASINRWNEVSRRGFSPRNDLNHCWSAESRIYDVLRGTPFLYADILHDLIIEMKKIPGWGKDLESKHHYWLMAHALPKYKCEAMLKAIGAIE
jgi:hypothetical protein